MAAIDQQSHSFSSGATAATAAATISAITAPHVSSSSSSLYPRDSTVSTNITEPPSGGLLTAAASDISVLSTASAGKSAWSVDCPLCG